MRAIPSNSFYRVMWGSCLLVGLGVFLVYARFPADGATGDLESFGSHGFLVQWLLEERDDGLVVGDVIVSAGGHTAEEWLGGASPGPEWRDGGVVTYEVLRDGHLTQLQIEMSPVPLRAIIDRWGIQLLMSLALLVVGGYVSWKRPGDLTAGALMLFCTATAVQAWGDAYNIQHAILTSRVLFWFQLVVEFGAFAVTFAAICNFALIFPVRHPLVDRYPHLVFVLLYTMNPLAVAVAMVLSPTWSLALLAGSRASWAVAVGQAILALMAGFRSLRAARDPVSQAQLRWILWGFGAGVCIAIPGYIAPLALTGRPLIPHPTVIAAAIGLVSIILAIPVMRFRLFDIELVINRSLVYGVLTALLGGAYLILVRVMTLVIPIVFGRQGDTLAVFVTTLAVALAFNPLRHRLQVLIDRAFYRSKVNYQRLLPDMTERLATSTVLGQLDVILTEELPNRLQIEGASLLVLDPDGEMFVAAGDGRQPELRGDHPLVEASLRLNRPLARLQPPPGLLPVAQTWLEDHQVELVIPLIVGDDLVGLYNLGPKRSGLAYNREEMDLLQLLGRQVAVSVQNSRLFHAEQEQRRLAEALQEAADVVSSTLNLDTVLDRILEQVVKVMEGDLCNVMLLEAGLARVVRWRGYSQVGVYREIEGLAVKASEYGTLTRMIEEHKPVLVSDTAIDPDWVDDLEGFNWLRSYVGAPIQIAGETVGFLNVDSYSPGRFGLADAHRLEAFAHHAATAIKNARLYHDVLRQADDLQVAVARLEELDRLKTEFIQNVSHELRSPLALIRGYAELLASGELGPILPEQTGPVEIIARRAQMLGELVDDIIHILLAEVRQQQREPIALGELAAAAVKDFEVVAERAGLVVRGEVASGLPPVEGEATQLRRVLDNLLSNAVKFTPPGGAVDLRVWCEDDQVMLEVSDTGIGIAPDQQTLVFDRFYQVNGSSTRRYGGVGLGLALVKELVQALGGSVGLTSTQGVGSTFTIKLPVLRVPNQRS